MNALKSLSSELQQFGVGRYRFNRTSIEEGSIKEICEQLEKEFKAGPGHIDTGDQIQKSLGKFVETGRLATLRDARRVCFGLTQPVLKTGSSLFEDRHLFMSVLDAHHGVDRWRDKPRAFRRCYQGLASSYFSFDGAGRDTSATARHNWHDLRDYLHESNHSIQRETFNPDWVGVAIKHREIFTESPFEILGEEAFTGESEYVRRVLDELSIDSKSWFHQGLLLSQVEHAVQLGDTPFAKFIPRLIKLVSDSIMVRDAALALILARYMECATPEEHQILRDTSVEWWGNPWLPSRELHWGRVGRKVRDVVEQWLQREFIEAFFSKLSEDGIGDPRRANFWLRYQGKFDDMRFGLGRDTLYSNDPDFKLLIKKMKGLYGPLEGPGGGNNAFIMTLGNLVVVEFGGSSNALYCYDNRKGLPFVVSKDRALRMPVDAPNSLKHSKPASELKLVHRDGDLGYAKWEDRFADLFRDQFGITPASQPRPRRGASGGKTRRPSRSLDSVDALIQEYNLTVQDFRPQGGNLWVRTDDSVHEVNSQLSRLGFGYKSGKGWWKKD